MRVLESVDTGDERSTLYVEDILTVLRTGKDFLVVSNQLLEEIVLPSDLDCMFSAQLDPKWYTMQDLVALKQIDFPVRVRLAGGDGARKCRNDVYVLNSVKQEANVLAKLDKELVAIPLDIDISVALIEGHMLGQSKSNVASLDTISVTTSLSTLPDGDTASVRKIGAQNEDSTSLLCAVGAVNSDDMSHKSSSQLYEDLQQKSAECLRLEVEIKALKAKYERLQKLTKRENGEVVCSVCQKSVNLVSL